MQAALLEVMEERQVTADGESRMVPRPFMVVATQNLLDFQGTYPLPEVQLDQSGDEDQSGIRQPGCRARGHGPPGRSGSLISELEPVLDQHSMAALIQRVRTVNVAVPLRSTSPTSSNAAGGRASLLAISTRGTLTLLSVARAYAGRGATSSPDDIKALYQAVLQHRAAVTPEAELDGITEADVLDDRRQSAGAPLPTDDSEPRWRLTSSGTALGVGVGSLLALGVIARYDGSSCSRQRARCCSGSPSSCRVTSPITIERTEVPRMVERGTIVQIGLRASADGVVPPVRIIDQLAGVSVPIDLPQIDVAKPVHVRCRIQAVGEGPHGRAHARGTAIRVHAAVRTTEHDVRDDIIVHPVVHNLKFPAGGAQRSATR